MNKVEPHDPAKLHPNVAMEEMSCPGAVGMGTTITMEELDPREAGLDAICVYCKITKRIRTSAEVQKGTHLVFNKGMDCSPIYQHHAIVTAMVKLVEFTWRNCTIGVFSTEKLLDFVKDTILATKHKDTPFCGDDIAARALSFEKQYARNGKNYNLFTNNCEHYANHCVLGNPISLQVEKAMNCMWSFCPPFLDFVSKWLRVVALLMYLLHGAVMMWADIAFIAITSVTMLFYLIIIIYRIAKNYYRQKNGKLCTKCGSAFRNTLLAEIPMVIIVWAVDMLLTLFLDTIDYVHVIVYSLVCVGFRCDYSSHNSDFRLLQKTERCEVE